MPETYPVLTARQPWAFGLLHGKPVENRTWEMRFRGKLWLHAGARSRWDTVAAQESTLIRSAWDAYVRTIPDWPGLPCSDVELNRKTTLMPFGAVAALMEVTGCHHADECSGQHFRRWRELCSPWAAYNQFHIEMTVIQELPEPVPCRGMLGLWRLPDDVEKAVREQLEAGQ